MALKRVTTSQLIVCIMLTVSVPRVVSVEAHCSAVKQQGGGTSVNCSHLDLTWFPKVTGQNVTELNAAFNGIPKVDKGALSALTNLTRVNLAHNQLSDVDQLAFTGLGRLQSVDLSHNWLTVLQDRTFLHVSSLRFLALYSNQIQMLGSRSLEGLTHLSHLDLANNRLQVLTNNTFVHLPHLTWLRLSANRLSSLEAGAFLGLNRLTYLDLSHNSLEMSTSALLPHVFEPVGQLEDLHIEHNTQFSMGSYPDGVFSDLVSLRRLTIDTFSDLHFGQDFAAMHHIETLDLTHNCGINIISNSSLEGFKNSTLSELLFDDCNIVRIELCAFCDLPALRQLQFKGGNTLPTKIIESLYGLQYQTMSEISLQRVGRVLVLHNTIGHRVARYLRNICVSTFKMVDCNVERITSYSVLNNNSTFSTCIENFDMSSNSITGDFSALLRLLISCPRLRTLQLQDQKTFSFTRARCLINQNYQCKEDLVMDPRSLASGTIIVPTPPNLTLLNLSSVFPHLNPLPSNLTFPTAKQLKTLDLSYLGLATCRATIYGLENLETLSLEGNICNNFTDTAFDMMPSLTTLSLSSIVLDQEFVSRGARRVFQNLLKLQVLDLSLNSLAHIAPDMLQAQAHLRELDLSGNRLQSVSVDLSHHEELRKLDLTHNVLTTLTLSEREALDSLADRHDVRLQLRGNPLACSCFNLDLVPWLFHTSVSLDGDGQPGNYTCTTEKGRVTSTEQVMAHWLRHWRGCVGERVFSVAFSAFLVQILGVVITFFVVRSWPQFYYAWRAIRNLHLPERRSFRKDAYLVYANVDDDVNLACVTLRKILEDRYHVRLLLPNRDGIGGYEAENIVQYIDDSWKVVLLVTRAFCGGDWSCGFATTQAQRSITTSMPDRVIVIFFEDVRGKLDQMDSLEMLLRMVPKKNVLYIRPGAPADHEVWKVLADTILYEPQKP